MSNPVKPNRNRESDKSMKPKPVRVLIGGWFEAIGGRELCETQTILVLSLSLSRR
ncbi:hypothetical protein YC2023_103217 [Brassica napus]